MAPAMRFGWARCRLASEGTCDFTIDTVFEPAHQFRSGVCNRAANEQQQTPSADKPQDKTHRTTRDPASEVQYCLDTLQFACRLMTTPGHMAWGPPRQSWYGFAAMPSSAAVNREIK